MLGGAMRGTSETMGLSESSSHGAGNEAAVLDPSKADKLLAQLLNGFARAAQDANFEAVVVVHVNVHGGDNVVIGLVLEFGHALRQIHCMVVVDEKDRRDRFTSRGRPFLLNQPVPNKVADRFRPVGIPLAADEFVKLLEQFFVQ